MGREVLPTFRSTYLRVLDMLASGYGLNEVARRLNAEGVPSSRGGRWYASTVRAIRDSRTAANVTEPQGQQPTENPGA